MTDRGVDLGGPARTLVFSDVIRTTASTIAARAGAMALACAIAIGPFVAIDLVCLAADAEPPRLLDVASGMAGLWLYGVLAHLALGEVDRAPVSFATASSGASRAFGGLFAVSFLQVFGIAIGLVLGIVPGVLLWAWSYLAAPLVVFERFSATAAMERSGAMTSGNRLTILALGGLTFGALLVAGTAIIAPYVIAIVLAGPEGTEIAEDRGVVAILAIAIVAIQAAWTVFSTVSATVVYARLRGPASIDRDGIAEVFR